MTAFAIMNFHLKKDSIFKWEPFWTSIVVVSIKNWHGASLLNGKYTAPVENGPSKIFYWYLTANNSREHSNRFRKSGREVSYKFGIVSEFINNRICENFCCNTLNLWRVRVVAVCDFNGKSKNTKMYFYL